MERLSNDVLSLVLGRVSSSGDRKSCSQVSPLWFTIEAQTRTRVRVLDPEHLPNFLPRFPNLTTLVVHVGISDQSLTFVAECCPILRTLDLNLLNHSEFQDDFGDEGLEAAARGCRHLVEVKLSCRKIGDKGIVALQKYAKVLAVLDLSFCELITDTSLAAIGDMKEISDLQFQECPLITDSGLNLLSTGPASRSLRLLQVCDCDGITDVGVFHLRRMSRLEVLNLGGCFKLTDVGGVAVSDISSLKTLSLSGQKSLTDETLFAVAKGCRNLVDISLDGCEEITGRGLVFLASSLLLERIDLSRLEDCRGLSSSHILKVAKKCRSLKRMIVDRELKKGLPRLQMRKLSGLCRVDWV